MTQEDKELLIKDLTARLPYGVKIELSWWVMGEWISIDTTLEADHIEELLNDEDGDTEIEPYLFPISRMTEEQKMFLRQQNWCIAISASGTVETTIEGINWLNKNHFDYRGLIEKGLAINATGLNIY
ncbi:MAG: hypothetical protein SOZ25_09815 [Prevotella sp.]|nr:hypothetical protein [Prevotella sp.]